MSFNPNQLRNQYGRWAADMVDKLERIMAAKGVPNARAEAVAHLQKSGVLKPGTEELTAEGIRRTQLGAAGRAKERAARQTGHKPEEYHATKGGRVYLK